MKMVFAMLLVFLLTGVLYDRINRWTLTAMVLVIVLLIAVQRMRL
ncbi:MAG: hypothetical protein ACOYOU_08045 [Kiritimatiellia bacterium]